MLQKFGFVYILTNVKLRTLYVGVTNNIFRRTLEHKEGTGSSFAKRYNVNILVYYQTFEFIAEAIVFEKIVKNRNREWKEKLINELNPDWRDLSDDWLSKEWDMRLLIN